MRALAVAVSLALALAAVPASAHPMGPHRFHHGFWGGPGLVFGLAGAALAIGAAEACVRYEPVYDDRGVYLGRRPVNVC